MYVSDMRSDEIKKLVEAVDDADLKGPEDARQFIVDLTKLVYDYKMIGKIYDFYTEDVEYHKQNKILFNNIEDVVRDVASFVAAFPDLTTKIEKVIVYKENDDFYKISKRLKYYGTNLSHSKYGPPTCKSLKDNCLSMSMLYLKRIGDKWKITFEINNDSEAWLREVMSL